MRQVTINELAREEQRLREEARALLDKAEAIQAIIDGNDTAVTNNGHRRLSAAARERISAAQKQRHRIDRAKKHGYPTGADIHKLCMEGNSLYNVAKITRTPESTVRQRYKKWQQSQPRDVITAAAEAKADTEEEAVA